MLDLRRIAQTFMVEGKRTAIHNTHPILKISGTAALFVAILFPNILIISIVLIVSIAESLVAGVFRRICSFLWGIRYFLITITVLSLIFYPPKRVLIILLRVIAGSVLVLCFVLTTNMMDLAQALDRLGIPSSITYATLFSIGLIPPLLKNASNSYEALVLRGEASPRIIGGGIITPLALLVAHAIERGEKLAEVLASKFFSPSGERTYFRSLNITVYGIIQLAFKLAVLIFALTSM